MNAHIQALGEEYMVLLLEYLLALSELFENENEYYSVSILLPSSSISLGEEVKSLLGTYPYKF